jgi:DNA-binding transcriptional ArsR family regulator
MTRKSNAGQTDPFEELDRVFHEKARLGILSSMIGAAEGLNFRDLKAVSGLTDGNLNRHLKVLLDAKILSVKKTGQGRNTNSHYRLSATGRRAFEDYLAALESIVKAAQENAIAASKNTARPSRKNDGLAGAAG